MVISLLAALETASSPTPILDANNESPFHAIAVRNAFKLVEKPAPPQPPQLPPVLPVIKLKGLTTFPALKRAALKVQFPAGAGTAAHEELLMLAEGERAGQIELLEIDLKSRRTKIRCMDTTLVVGFEKAIPAEPVELPSRPHPPMPK